MVLRFACLSWTLLWLAITQSTFLKFFRCSRFFEFDSKLVHKTLLGNISFISYNKRLLMLLSVFGYFCCFQVWFGSWASQLRDGEAHVSFRSFFVFFSTRQQAVYHFLQIWLGEWTRSPASSEGGKFRAWLFSCLKRFVRRTKKKERLLVVSFFHKTGGDWFSR